MDVPAHPHQDPSLVLSSLTHEALAELLTHYCVESAAQDAVDPIESPAALAGSIAFFNGSIRGSITIIASEKALAAALPGGLPPHASPLSAAADWSGELANQLAGRLKSKLLRYGTAVDMGVPSVVRGDRMSAVRRRTSTEPRWTDLQVAAQWGDFRAWADIQVHDDLRLDLQDSGDLPAAEGETCFF